MDFIEKPLPPTKPKFTKFLLKNKEIRSNIFLNLNNESLNSLSQTNKKIKKMIKLHKKK